MRIMLTMNGSTEGSMSVSHIKLDVCSLLTLIHERQLSTADLVKLRKKVTEVISNKLF